MSKKIFGKLLKQYISNNNNIKDNKKNNNIINAKVIKINKDFVMVDSNLKSESYISIKEFYDNEGKISIKINDIVELFLEEIDNGYGETILSREKAKLYRIWNDIYNKYKNNLNIEGYIKSKVKGGLIIDINNNINAFLPGSLIGVNSSDKNLIDELENKKLTFKLIKIDKKGNSVILSRKAVLDININIEKAKIINSLNIDDILCGIVKNITEYGAFIDLGKLDGLLHITDISWKRIKHPSEILKIGMNIKVKILRLDIDKLRIYLGFKQLNTNELENKII